ncbi:MAG: hypothetical protein IT462_17645 [Planctomycetes bacterium]|nr:hypothetical protein [Planctomycetota bacterium]
MYQPIRSDNAKAKDGPVDGTLVVFTPDHPDLVAVFAEVREASKPRCVGLKSRVKGYWAEAFTTPHADTLADVYLGIMYEGNLGRDYLYWVKAGKTITIKAGTTVVDLKGYSVPKVLSGKENDYFMANPDRVILGAYVPDALKGKIRSAKLIDYDYVISGPLQHDADAVCDDVLLFDYICPTGKAKFHASITVVNDKGVEEDLGDMQLVILRREHSYER